MKKKLWYIFGLIIIFLVVIAVLLFKKGDTEDVKQPSEAMLMEEATLPIVYPCYENVRINAMHGYVSEVDVMSTRDALTPLNDDRLLNVEIDTYGTKLTGIAYEIRSMDMERLLESVTIEEWQEEEGIVKAVLPVDNLMTEGVDYHLIITLSLEDGREVRYYTRLISGLENVSEKLQYVAEFHEKTFDKEAALDLVRYLESGAKGDNTNYGAVNIYSSFNQITWGDLSVERVGEPDISLTDVNGNISYFTVEYFVRFENMYDHEELYRVKEYYRTRHTSTRTYLLNFERTMEQYFNPIKENIYTNNINVGITEEVDKAISDSLEDAGGKRVCFVRNGELWEYNSTDHVLTKIFSFMDGELDVRESINEHDIRIAKIDAEGNVTFVVYGYMNRGKHEGEVGISVCRYIEAEKKVEEILYIPYDKSFDMLNESFGGICYLNPSDWLYFIMEGTLYSLDIKSNEYTVVVDGLVEGSYVTNYAGNTLVWQTGEASDSREIKILNLETSKELSVSCANDEVLKLLGYMEDDIVYGVAKKADTFTDISGEVNYYFYKLCIIDEGTTDEIGLYQKDNIYIKEAEISEGMITLGRYTKDENGEFAETSVDYLTRNASETRKALSLRFVATELKKKEAVLTISGTVQDGKPEVLEIKDVYFDNTNQFTLSATEDVSERYYVYAKGSFMESFANLSDAIVLADQNVGLVVDEAGRYIWKRGNSYSSINLSDISVQVNETNTLSACIDAMLKKAGVVILSENLLTEGKSVSEIVNNEDVKYLSFEGLSLDKILYSINDSRPVIGKLSDEEYVLITGYDSSSISVYSAITGSRTKISMSEATKKFEEQGNVFFGYINK